MSTATPSSRDGGVTQRNTEARIHMIPSLSKDESHAQKVEKDEPEPATQTRRRLHTQMQAENYFANTELF